MKTNKIISIFKSFFSRNKKVDNLKYSDYGRIKGWEVILKSNKIAELTNPIQIDMFWYRYDIELKDLSFSNKILEQEFWEDENIKLHSIALGAETKGNHILNLYREDGINRIIARNLLVNLDERSL